MQVLGVLRLKLRYGTKVNERCFSRSFSKPVRSEFPPILKLLFFHLACLLKYFQKATQPCSSSPLANGPAKSCGWGRPAGLTTLFQRPLSSESHDYDVAREGNAHMGSTLESLEQSLLCYEKYQCTHTYSSASSCQSVWKWMRQLYFCQDLKCFDSELAYGSLPSLSQCFDTSN